MMNQNSISVLYIDDEEDMLDVCKLYLELSEDIRIETEVSVDRAERRLDDERFDAIISDYQMPEMSGIDFLKRLRAKGNDIPFILFTGKGREEVVIEAINSGADSYVQKGGEARSQFVELGHKVRKLVEKKRAERSLKESEERYRMLFEGIQEGMAYCQMLYDQNGEPIDWRYLKVNAQFTALTGLEDIEERNATEVIPGIMEQDRDLLAAYDRVASTGAPDKFEIYFNSLAIWLDISVISPTRGFFIAIFENVTARKLDEQERETTIEFLRLVNTCKNVKELVGSAITFFRKQSGCEAVGIRLKDGFDYPYYETRGFDEGFVLLETHLCSYDDHGELCMDGNGYPILECMCGNVICGRFDVTKDFFTANGSFWTNNTTKLLATSTEDDRHSRTRNRCNVEGYESVALIPLSMGRERYGLLQMNDRRIGIFSPQLIARWERLAGYLSVALSKFLADEALIESEVKYLNLFESIEESAGFFEYVLDGGGEVADFICRDVNPAALAAMGYDSKEDVLGRRMGGLGPERTLAPPVAAIAEMRRTGKTVITNIHLTARNRDFITAIIPIDEDHFILTSRDETDVVEMKRMADNDASRMKAIMDVLPIGLILTDETGAIMAINDIARKLWGGSFPMAENVAGYGIYKGWWRDTGKEISPDEWGAAQAISEGRTVLGQVLTIQGFDGVMRSMVNNAAPIRTREGRIVGAVAATQDITESMLQEESLRIANGKLKLLDKINRHDIRNQLTVLRGSLELVRRMISDSEGLKRLEQAGKAAEMIEKHVNFAKQYQELGRTSPTWQSLKVEITKASEGFEQIDLRMDGEQICNPEILADPMLPKVFQNLFENSQRYADRPTRIKVHCERDGTDLLVVYEDRGQGIPGPEKEKVFEKGYGKGSGMGLFLIREILAISGIEISENGIPGQGARFEVRVPPGRFRNCG
ncbi:MAG TPA: response regulator [Methanomassiliicoccales archaeon]|jgi:PAS domain S-box-containing protein